LESKRVLTKVKATVFGTKHFVNTWAFASFWTVAARLEVARQTVKKSVVISMLTNPELEEKKEEKDGIKKSKK